MLLGLIAHLGQLLLLVPEPQFLLVLLETVWGTQYPATLLQRRYEGVQNPVNILYTSSTIFFVPSISNHPFSKSKVIRLQLLGRLPTIALYRGLYQL
jgi:hypothetical protein